LPNDPSFARMLQSGVKIIDVNAATLQKRTLKEELEAKLNETVSPQNIKIEAKFWNPRAGDVQTVYQPGKLQKRKHQINSLAFQAQAMEVEVAKTKARGLRTRQQSMAKYGW